MAEEVITIEDNDALLAKLKAEKEAAVKFQKRRHTAWRETYELYRDIVETNELTQRQEVNIPIMRETKKTLLSDIDEPPDVIFDCLEKGDEAREKEIYINEIWQDDYDKCNFEGIDILEKNNVLLYGRTFKILNFTDGKFTVEVPDNLDIVVDPKVNPLDIETAKYFVRLHIYKSLRTILADPKYEEEGKKKLKQYLQGQDRGLIQFAENYDEENQKSKEEILDSLGIDNFDELNAADLEVELNEHFTLIWDKKKKEFVRYVVVVGADNAILSKKTLKEVLGIEFWPVTTWADDLDNKDFWSDGIGDIVRTPNKVMNIYFSTMLENRVYRNLGMFWYLPVPGYDPQTFEPEPFGQYPAPLVEEGGRYMPVEQVIRRMDIPALEENLVSIDFLIKLIERATAATAIKKGVSEKKQITLGEVQEITEEASKRIVSIAKFYRRAWKEFAWKWRGIREANASKKTPIKIYKKEIKGSYLEKAIYPKDWISDAGYRERVQSSSEQEGDRVRGLNKLFAIQARFPNNLAVQKIVEKRMLDTLDLTPDEMREIKSAEKAPQAPAGILPGTPPGTPGAVPPMPQKAEKPY